MLTVDMYTYIPPTEVSDLAGRYDYGGFVSLSLTATARFHIPESVSRMAPRKLRFIQGFPQATIRRK